MPKLRTNWRFLIQRKIGFLVFLVYFGSILLVGPFSYSVGGQVFCKARSGCLVFWILGGFGGGPPATAEIVL